MSAKTLQVVLRQETTSTQAAVAPSERPLAPITYQQLTDFHLDRIKLDKEGRPRPEQSLKNQRSGVNSWLRFNGLSESSVVGEELGIKFNDRLAKFLAKVKRESRSEQTPSDRKSTVVNLHESFKDLVRISGLPESFAGALSALIENSGHSLLQISLKTAIHDWSIANWAAGNYSPSKKSLPKIQQLEDFFEVSRGILSSRLPVALREKNSMATGGTPWRKHQRVLMGLPYVLKVFPPHVDHEWHELFLFYTDAEWVEERGLKRSGEWRIRWNNGRCVTGEKKRKDIERFFGYLCLPSMHEDKRSRGQGFSSDDLSLALFSDADLVRRYLYFMKGRSVTQSFNSQTKNFLSFSCQLLRPETGFLWQLPHFGSMLPQKVKVEDWHDWCETNLKKICDFRKEIQKNKKDSFRKTRDPFAAVRNIIVERQHPITILFELSDRLEQLTPLLESCTPHTQAIHSRDNFLVRLLGSNPLRIENLSMMTHIPRDYEVFRRVCKLYLEAHAANRQLDLRQFYVETTRESNLYQLRDGSWWLRFDERDFKNERGDDIERGVLHTPYDVEIVPSVWPSLTGYLFKHRPALNQELKSSINGRRVLSGMSELSEDQAMAIEQCPYVFRPGVSSVLKMGLERFVEFGGTEQINPWCLSRAVYKKSQTYLPDCIGFCANACRHLVASEYIRNHPDGEAVAAAALHNTIKMVRKHYAWVPQADKIRPWNQYHEELHRMYDAGEL